LLGNSFNYLTVFTVLGLKKGIDRLLSQYSNLSIFAGKIIPKPSQRFDFNTSQMRDTMPIGNIGQLVSY
jgi:hypothetical protein